MTELIKQTGFLGKSAEPILNNPATTAIELDRLISEKIRSKDFPIENFGAPLACSLIPWIDSEMESGQTREEWKGFVEANKILEASPPIPIDGICVRVGVMRCHSQAVTIKLKKDVPIADIVEIIKNGNDWVKVASNDKVSTLAELTPAAVSGKLIIPIGRIRKMSIGDKYLTAFTVGDQLLWGAAEPLRRALKIIIEHISG
jgi:aspartate-semialdehyde dehydrogenase